MFEEKEENNKEPKWLGTVFICIIVILFILIVRYNNNEQDEYKKTFEGETIGLATRIKHSGKTSSLRYYFYTDKKILSEVSGRDNDLVNKFYKIKYDLNNPEENYIVLEEELEPDSISLVKAGFTKTKYYIYDAGITCKYIEKSKWK
jgi:hypothetical protein